MGLIDKVKDKLHIGDSDSHLDKKTSGTSGASATSGTTSSGAVSKTGATTAHGASGTASAPGTTTSSHNAGSNPSAVATHHTGGPVSTQPAPEKHESVTVHERDPNWHKARELTSAAEYQSKVSAAKAYEAEAYLVGATESHDAAQAAINKRAELAAQAEAEKRNIGAADYIHREYDHAKKEAEDREKHHVEINKNLETTRGLVKEKEAELGAVAPGAVAAQKEIDALSNKLGALQGAKSDLENKSAAHAGALGEVEGTKSQYESEVARLQSEVERLNTRATDLEAQAKQARAAATDASAKLKEVKDAHAGILKEADKHNRGLAAVNKDLEGYRAKEADLANKLQGAQVTAKQAADLAAAKEAELQLAKQQYEAERQKGLPVEQDIERYRKVMQEKERELVEAQESSKAARAAYEKFNAQALEAEKEAQALVAEKERKISNYQEHKQEANVANSRATEMWAEAKKFGNTGDANALQRLAHAEQTLGEHEGVVAGGFKQPVVAPKQPTTEGPKIHRSENAKETNEETSSEKVSTKY